MSAINLNKDKFLGEKLPDLEIVRLIYTYKKKHPKKSTVAIHLTTDDLKNIITEIESMADPDRQGNGVTFYIGKYPPKYPRIKKQGNADYSNRLTVVAVPTYKGTTNDTYFDFMDQKTVKKYKKIIDGAALVEESAGGFDHYKLCPPDTGCANANIIWNNLD